jgi:fatty acid CoA ligase FadD36
MTRNIGCPAKVAYHEIGCDDGAVLTALTGEFADAADAVVVADEASSWEALAGRADALGARIGGAATVAVPGTPTLDTLVAVVAALRAGVPVVPVPPDAGPVERGHILRDSRAALIVGDPDWPDTDLPRVPIPAGGGLCAQTEPDPEAPAIVMYTSGTTGLPKGAVIPRRAIVAGLEWLADAWGWTAADTLAHGLPLFHVHGLVLGMLGPLRVGSRLRHTGRPTPERYAAEAAAGATMLFGVPTVWSRVVADPASARALATARVLVSGSAPLPVPVFEQLAALTGQAPLERYGMTETLITLSTRHDGERRPGSVGVPIRAVDTRLMGDDGAPVASDGEAIGGLQVRGPTLFSGYLGQPERTAEAFAEGGWFVTGDAAVIGPDGFHRIVGRASIDIIKCAGYKVGAGEVETALLGHPAVAEVAVLGLPDGDLGERIVAFVVAAGPVAERELIDHVAAGLSNHKRPREVRFVESLPRNAMGKVQKATLRSL